MLYITPNYSWENSGNVKSPGFLLSQGNQGKSGNLKIGQRIQGKSQNSVDVREKSGNFISSCGKKENDSF